MSRREALALGLPTHPSPFVCRKRSTSIRVTWTRACVECDRRAKAAKQAFAEKARLEVRATALGAAWRQLKAEERQRQREAEKEAKRAAREAEKEARQRVARAAMAKATREANKAAKALQAAAPPAHQEVAEKAPASPAVSPSGIGQGCLSLAPWDGDGAEE
jgi:hypothetical protein